MVLSIEILYVAYVTLGVTIAASLAALVSAFYTDCFMEKNACRYMKSLLGPLETLDLQLAERALSDGFIESLANQINLKAEDIKKEKNETSQRWKGEIPLEYEFALIVPKDEGKIYKPSNVFLSADSNDPNYQTFAHLPDNTFTASKEPFKVPGSKTPASTDPSTDPRVPMARAGDPNYQTLAYVPNTFEDKKTTTPPPKTPTVPTVSGLEPEDAYENLQDSG